MENQVPMPTYERIFEKRAKGELQGREFLKKYYPQQWRIYTWTWSLWGPGSATLRILGSIHSSLPICGTMRILRQMSRISSRNTVGLWLDSFFTIRGWLFKCIGRRRTSMSISKNTNTHKGKLSIGHQEWSKWRE